MNRLNLEIEYIRFIKLIRKVYKFITSDIQSQYGRYTKSIRKIYKVDMEDLHSQYNRFTSNQSSNEFGGFKINYFY